jgi:DNA transposition AAA+ family ATPase
MITTEIQHRIVAALVDRRNNFAGSDAKFAVSIGINHAQYSRIKNGDHDRVLSDQNWLSLARLLEIQIGNRPQWNIARTPVYEFITDQLLFCQEHAASRLLCDIAGVGKTFSARAYVRSHKNAIYVDCSQVTVKQELVRFIAKEFGVGHSGKYSNVRADLVFYLRSLSPTPLIIIDEAGDLKRDAFKELKALWNATEGCCGWYMMGADGLRATIKKSINNETPGYTEMFSRYGSRFQKTSPDTADELRKFITVHAALIIKANAPEGSNIDIQKLLARTDYSLRRIADELRKIG